MRVAANFKESKHISKILIILSLWTGESTKLHVRCSGGGRSCLESADLYCCVSLCFQMQQPVVSLSEHTHSGASTSITTVTTSTSAAVWSVSDNCAVTITFKIKIGFLTSNIYGGY